MFGRKLHAIGGLLLAAALGMMLFGAATAQAAYHMLENGKGTGLVEHTGILSLFEMETNSGTKIHCEGGVTHIHVEELASKDDVNAIEVDGKCTVKEAPACTISSKPGEEDGLIVMESEGELTGMNGEEYFAVVKGSPLATIYFEGLFCPLSEKEALSGSMLLTILEAEQSLKTHTLLIEGQELVLGSEPVEFGAEAVIEDVTEAAFAIHLV